MHQSNSSNLADFPDFLGIGVVKAGTTWLHNNLQCHPELYLPPLKPINFFDKYFVDPPTPYLRLFESGRGRKRGEVTASYSVLPRERIRRLHTFNPRLRLILLLRDFRSRAWSELRMEMSLFRRKACNEVPDEDFLDLLDSQKIRERGDYLDIYRRWTEIFPREQIFVGLYDEISQRPDALLGRIFEFLGVSIPVDWSAYPLRQKAFEGPAMKMPLRVRRRLEECYGKPEVDALEREVGLGLSRYWRY